MTLQYAPVILPLLLSAGLGIGLGRYAWRHRHGRESVQTYALVVVSSPLLLWEVVHGNQDTDRR